MLLTHDWLLVESASLSTTIEALSVTARISLPGLQWLHPRLNPLSSYSQIRPTRTPDDIFNQSTNNCLQFLALVSAFGMLSGGVIPAAAQEPTAAETHNVFKRPQFADEQQRHTINVLKLFRRQQYADAEQALRKLILKFPDWPMHHFNLAATLARQDKTNEALDSLELALGKGFANRQAIEKNPAFNTLRGLPRFQTLLDGMRQSSTSPLQSVQNRSVRLIDDGVALVDETNTFGSPTAKR